MGAKIETQKNPMPILQAIKISSATTRPGHAGTIMNLQIVSNTQNNSYLNQAPQKNTCQNFPTQTKSWNQKFQTQKNPLIIPVTWNPKSLPPTPGSWTQALINTSYWPFWSRHLHLHRCTAGEARGAAAPSNFGQLKVFGQHEKIWAKPVFKDVCMFLLLFWRDLIFSILTWSQHNNPVTLTRDRGCLARDEFLHGYKGKVSYANFFYCWALYCNGLFPLVNLLERTSALLSRIICARRTVYGRWHQQWVWKWRSGWLILSLNYKKNLIFLKRSIKRFKTYSLIC